MYYLADTVNIEEIKKILRYFPLQGITTNPTILAAEGKKLSAILPELVNPVDDKMLHVQMIR